MIHALSLLIFIPVLNRIVLAQTQNLPFQPQPIIKCSQTQSCPEEWPCCSQYWTCGSGPYCVTGCNPKMSFSTNSCLPQAAFLPPNVMRRKPFIKSEADIYNLENSGNDNELTDEKEDAKKSWVYNFSNDMDGLNKRAAEKKFESAQNSQKDYFRVGNTNIMSWTKYLIADDANAARAQWDNVDFTYSGTLKISNAEDSEIYLTMPKKTAGSLLTTTQTMLYGKVAVKLKTARSRGVVTSIVLFSSVHDEIDFEFLGGDLHNAQTNYYHQGELIHTRMKLARVSSDTYENYHMYEIDWNENRIIWLIDGKPFRTLTKEETWDPVENIYKYPQTPMKLHIAVWPGGDAQNHPGTVAWAGGLIDWDNAPDITEKGEFDCKVKEILVQPFETNQLQELQQTLLNFPISKDSRIYWSFDAKNNNPQNFDAKDVALNAGPVPYLQNSRSNGANRQKL
ncbi:hypothetical protein ACO0QE_004367 [Hanseniaspora vineae]